MSSYLIDSFRGGISDFDNKGIKGSAKFTKGLDIRRISDTLYCHEKADDITWYNLTGLPLWIVPATDGNLYAFCDNGEIVMYDLTAGTASLVYTDTDGKIKGAASWYDDDGTAYLYWATDTKLNRKAIPGTSDWSDVNDGAWQKTDLTSVDWHTMKVAVGALYICNGETIAMVGYDSSYTNEALRLQPGSISKSLIERTNYLIVGCTRDDAREQSELYLWDTIATAYNSKKVIWNRNIQALIDTEYPLMCVGNGYLYYSDLNNIIPITQIPGGTGFNRDNGTEGGTINPDAVDVDNGVALFGYGQKTGNTGIYSFGRKMRNHNPVLNFDHPITCTDIGSVKRIHTGGSYDGVWVSYKNGTSYGMKLIHEVATVKETGSYYGLSLKAPSTMLGYLPTWKNIIIRTLPLPVGSKIEVFYQLDKAYSVAAIQAQTQDESTSFATTDGKEAIFLINESAKVLDYEIRLTPSVSNVSPEIYEIEVTFE